MVDAQADYDKTKKDLISGFNEAKFQIFRLHNEWSSCNSLSQVGHLTRWKWKLDTIWRELSADAREKDGYDDWEKWNDEGIKKEGTYINVMTKLNQKIAESSTPDKLYNALQEKEVFLRCLQDDVGKGSKRKSPEEDDLDE